MQKIAVLGGGIGSLSAALELTNDPNWQANYDITVYQMGWRCGGKGASGRNREVSDRIQEHGIHLWMGFYENAFHLIRHAYAEAQAKNLMPTSPFTDVRKAFSPMRYTPMMEQVGNEWKIWALEWPGSDEFPGEDATFEHKLLTPTPWDFVKQLIGFVLGHLESHKHQHPILVELFEAGLANITADMGSLAALPGPAGTQPHPTLLHRAATFASTLHTDVFHHQADDHQSLLGWLKQFLDKLLGLVMHLLERDDELRRFVIIADTAISAVIGILEDDLLRRGFLAIEGEDFIDWLTRHGCRHAKSAITLGFYDACFGYRHGEKDQLRMGAGSVLYGGLRLMFTYKGALMWWMNAGMGETIFSPIYLVLKSRGVKFEFFHKVTNLGVSADKQTVDRIEIDVQATTKGDYDPLFLGVDGIPVWPTGPLWEQVVEADEIRKCTNDNLESWWTDWKGVGSKTLQRGVDFDLVILGISLGAHKYICRELVEADASGGWLNMLTRCETVRTQGLQLWLNQDLAAAGWPHARGILSGWVEPFDTWSDMSPLIPRERWTPADNVQQIAYFCNAIPDTPTAPFSDPNFPQVEWARVKENARNFLDANAGAIWPNVRDPKDPKKFNDQMLVNCFRDSDPKLGNFDTQFFRVNIDPSELYVLSLPGTAQYRLEAGKSGFANLYLAGDWTLTDLNVGCIEATVISARMCSQAICGKPDHIYGAFGAVVPIVPHA